MKVNLLGKTELWIGNLTLERADLNAVAAVAAEVLGLGGEEVFVTDASENHLTLDILRAEIDAERLYGKKGELLKALAAVPGVRVSPETNIHSEGILGFIILDEQTTKETIARSNEMASEIRQRIRARCMVFPTGEEVRKGLIKDTNSPLISDRLDAEGYKVKVAPALPDDADAIAAELRNAVDGGYGLIITTGGVGAESKDRTVEALLSLDPSAAAPYVTRYHQGTGRHEKEGVRIAVGEVGSSLLVALPGPNDEVRVSLEALISGIKDGSSKESIAEAIAAVLKSRYASGHAGEVQGGRWA